MLVTSGADAALIVLSASMVQPCEMPLMWAAALNTGCLAAVAAYMCVCYRDHARSRRFWKTALSRESVCSRDMAMSIICRWDWVAFVLAAAFVNAAAVTMIRVAEPVLFMLIVKNLAPAENGDGTQGRYAPISRRVATGCAAAMLGLAMVVWSHPPGEDCGPAIAGGSSLALGVSLAALSMFFSAANGFNLRWGVRCARMMGPARPGHRRLEEHCLLAVSCLGLAFAAVALWAVSLATAWTGALPAASGEELLAGLAIGATLNALGMVLYRLMVLRASHLGVVSLAWVTPVLSVLAFAALGVLDGFIIWAMVGGSALVLSGSTAAASDSGRRSAERPQM